MKDFDRDNISTINIKRLRNEERIRETLSILTVIANRMAMPLFLMFWVADWLYVPQLKWEFLIVRLFILPIGFSIHYFSSKISLLSDIHYLIKERLPPWHRDGLREFALGPLRYWVFQP